MKKKNKYVLIVVCAIILAGMVLMFNEDKGIVLNDESDNSGNLLAVYIEDEEGEFVFYEDNAFPVDGFVLDIEKSSCTNGVLSQNPETKKIRLVASDAGTCNLYFKKDVKPVITAVNFKSISSTQTAYFDSITLEKEMLIKDYYLSINGGEYKPISLKDTIPYDFCANYVLTASKQQFSLYAVSVTGLQSVPFSFQYGGFDCSLNISVSISEFDRLSTSMSTSIRDGESAPEEPDPGEVLPPDVGEA